jgi:flagellum-specific ATP synthase
MEPIHLDKYLDALAASHLFKERGKVTHVQGALIKAFIPGACLGSLCAISTVSGRRRVLAEVVGFQDRNVLLMPLGSVEGIGHGSTIYLVQLEATFAVSDGLLGRIIDAEGRTIDGLGPILGGKNRSLYGNSENPLKRPPIEEALDLGVRSINGLLTVGKGQRIGIMAGSGVGKSVLLGMMARNSAADINVICLIGERGREVREFIEHELGEEGLRRSVIVVGTSDQSALVRMRGAFIATVIAEYFSEQGKDVLFMMDSVTRFAMAQREIGLSSGEPPATKGYTPSVFGILPKLLERAGRFEGRGSITGIYTVLVEGDDMDDPIGDAVRSIVDGHIVLARSLAEKGHFPAVDILQSISRVMRNVTSREHQFVAQRFRENLATYRDVEDLIKIGAYRKGVNEKIDYAIDVYDQMMDYLKQEVGQTSTLDDSISRMQGILR